MPEYFDVLDQVTGELTGRKELRSFVHKTGLPHACIHLWIYDVFNSVPHLLLQRRAKQKESFPYYFDISSAGHLSSGENYLVCVVRELFEELGILLTFELPPNTSPSTLAEIKSMVYSPSALEENSGHCNDSEELRDAVAAAQFLFDHYHSKSSTSTTLTLEERYPSRQHDVIITTSSNTSFSRKTTLFFCGKFRQDAFIVSDDYVDNEFAYIFFLKDTFLTREQVQEKRNDHEKQQSCESNDQNELTNNEQIIASKEHNDQKGQNDNDHHIIQFLDDEVASVIYTPLHTYLQLQQQLTDQAEAQKKQGTQNTQHNENSTNEKHKDKTQFDSSRSTGVDALDVLNPEWLVPVINLDRYRRDVFDKMIEVLAKGNGDGKEEAEEKGGRI